MSNIPYFNELYDEKGVIRKHYASVFSQWHLLSAQKQREIFKNSERFFSRDYREDPLPRIIIPSELSLLKQGVEQRAQAILAFLCDYYGEESRWKKFIPPSALERIIARNQRARVLGKLKPCSIAFPYGPDVIRDRSGKWKVIEDSAGMIGGIGDLLAARKSLGAWFPRHNNILGLSNNPIDFFNRLSMHYQRRAQEKQGIAVVYLPSFKGEADHEAQRLSRIFKSVGIEYVMQSDEAKRLTVEAHGIYLCSSYRKIRVGYLVLRSSPEDMDLHSLSLSFKKCHIHTSKQLRISLLKQGLEIIGGNSLTSALLKQKAWTNFSPGVEFVNDKGFGIYVDAMVQFYLKKDPLLESISSRGFTYRSHHGKWKVDRRFLNKVIRNKDKFVIKKVDEDGGEGVWIGQKLPRKQWVVLKDKIMEDPERFIVQKFEHLSVLENRIVDLRIHVHVDCEEIITSNTPWGRANWIYDDGKVNLRSNGFTSPVLTLK